LKQLRSLGSWLIAKAHKFGLATGRTTPHVVGHKEITLPGHGTLCPGSEMPLAHIRDWYHQAAVLQQAMPPLDEFLAHNSSSGVRTQQAAPGTEPKVSQVDVVAIRVDLTEPQQNAVPLRGLLVANKSAYVELADLAHAAGLVLAWHPEERRATIAFPHPLG
jgi:hypothetical protein